MSKRVKVNKHPDWKMSKGEKGWYYLGDTARLFCSSLVASYMTLFLMFQGISTASVATAILIVKIIDSVDDVLFGFLVDKIKITEWKFLKKLAGKGKYMPWYRLFFWTFPIATILFYMMPKDASEIFKIGWFTVTYLLYDFSCTLTEVPMQSMVTTLTDSPSERNSILTVKGVITVIAAVGMAIIISALLSESVGVPIKTIGIGGALIFLTMMLPMVFKVQEHNTELKNVEQEGSQEQYTFKDMVQCVFTNKYILIYFLVVIISTLFNTRAAIETFIGFYIFNDSMVFSYVMLIGFIPGIILSGFCGKIADKVGKRNLLAFIFVLIAVASLILYFFGRDNKVFFIVIGGLCAIPNALIAVVRTYIAPDTIEYTRYKTGKDCAGIFYALQSFLTKAFNGVTGTIALYILAFYGWKEVQAESFADLATQGVTQSTEALDALWNVGYLIPTIGFIISAILLFAFYKLKDKDAELMTKCNAGQITREECEAQLSRKY
ncbi:MAG: MFS transporter [Agathobacter sp.]|nr:MFS transporter [Agathobacter sp.]MBQ6812983.1 MFS transporter [Agathobacter sp.]